MYLDSSRDRRPAWFRDAKWIAGLVLVVAAAGGLLTFSLSSVTNREASQGVLRAAIAPVLVPDGGAPEAALAGVDLRAGEPFRLLPSVDVSAPAADASALTPASARARIASELAGTVVAQGADAALERASEGALRDQLAATVDGPAREMLYAQLERSMLPSGLGDGSRMANWRLQRAYALGQPVQPIVGVFVLLDPRELEPLTAREIGVRVVHALADTVLASGVGEARALVTNQNLLARLTETVNGEGRASLERLFETALLRDDRALADRLEQVREVNTVRSEAAVLSPMAALAERLDAGGAADRDARVLDEVAGIAWESGSSGVLALVPDAAQSEALAGALAPLEVFSAAANARLTGYAWAFGVTAVLALVALLVFSAGLMRMFNVGVALMAASVGGVMVFWPLAQSLQVTPGLFAAEASGALESPVALLRTAAVLPPALVERLAYHHLLVLAVGAGLVVLFVLFSAFMALRPRRSRF